MRRSLTRAGFAVETAECGSDAVAVVQRCPPDLVILDSFVVGKSDVLERIATERSRVAVLLLGEHCRQEELAQVDGCLAKPFAMQELLARVRALVAGPCGAS